MQRPMNELCERLGISVPIFAFTRSPRVVSAVSRAGGFGVLGAIGYQLDELDVAIAEVESELDGAPYGADVVMPAVHVGKGQDVSKTDLEKMLPEPHRLFVNEILQRHGVPPLPPGVTPTETLIQWSRERTMPQVDKVLGRPIKLLANALGPPPADVIERAHAQGVLVAALCGSPKHARKHVAAGVDIVIAQGTEAGGHCGDVSTFVNVPDVVDAVAGRAYVLAAGGVGTGRQMAAALALGADGVWCGSLWLTTRESMEPAFLKNALLQATSRDTVRSKALTGKPARQLKTPWTDAWETRENPDPLPMPLHFMLIADAVQRMRHHAADNPDSDAARMVPNPVGQIVGRMNEPRAVADIMTDMVNECRDTIARLGRLSF